MQSSEQTIIRDLGNGLVLRHACAKDAPELVAMANEIFNARSAAVIQHFMRDDWAICDTQQFTVVEDTQTGRIASYLCLIAQEWAYEGITFGVGQPEFVLTRPEYRNRGLIRAQIEEVHRWSEARGDLVQAITGIPYFYRQFGYEMGLAFGGSRTGGRSSIVPLQEEDVEPYLVRPATMDDLPFIIATYNHSLDRYAIVMRYSESDWRYMLEGWSEDEPQRDLVRIITTPSGTSVGFLTHLSFLRPKAVPHQLVAGTYELTSGVSWLAVTPSVLRYLKATGAAMGPEFTTVNFWLGPQHPVYEAAALILAQRWEGYAFYVRVPNLPAFLQRITPALEQRVVASIAVGHTGELKLSFYRSGLRLVFDHGKLITVEPWQPTSDDGGDARFPDLTFLQVLFGYRALTELQRAYADCTLKSDNVRVLLDTLFPQRVSQGRSWASDD